jgi:hypothetical protein
MYNITTYKEFGFILMYYLPKTYALFEKGLLKSTNSRLGTKSLFYFSPNHIEINKHDDNGFPQQLECYSYNAPSFTLDMWTPPNLKQHYKNTDIIFNKPILTINNKNTIEWQKGIFNYFDSITLRNIIENFKDSHQIIYIRPFYNNSNITKDTLQNIVDIGDYNVLSEYKDVITIEDLYENGKYESYNELQFKILANSECHIAPAGDSIIPAYFGGDLLMYNHPNCNSTNRGIWRTDSWLKLLSNVNVYGFNNHNDLLNKAIELWK